MSHSERPFYGSDILRKKEQLYIQSLLKKHKGKTADEDLKKMIYDELQEEKHLGNIKIPFKVALKNDPDGKFPPCIEVLLDTKV